MALPPPVSLRRQLLPRRLAASPPAVLDLVGALVDHSLLRRLEQDGGEPRLFMLQTIREFAVAELAACGEEPEARTAHAAYYVATAERTGVSLKGAEEARWLDRVGLEIDNIRGALDWLISTGGKTSALTIITSVRSYWLIRSSFNEAHHWMEQALTLPGEVEPNLQLQTSRFAAWLFTMAGDHDQATAYADALLALAEEIGDAAGNATVLNTLGAIAFQRGNLIEAHRWWEAALQRADASTDSRALAGIYNNLGVVAGFRGEIAPARHYQEQSLRLHREFGTPSDTAGNLDNLAHLACLEGELERAAEIGWREARQPMWRESSPPRTAIGRRSTTSRLPSRSGKRSSFWTGVSRSLGRMPTIRPGQMGP